MSQENKQKLQALYEARKAEAEKDPVADALNECVDLIKMYLKDKIKLIISDNGKTLDVARSNDKVKILCPYCLENEINPSQAICAVCCAKEDELERDHWNRLRERNNADEIQMYTLAQKVDEAFQVPEHEAYVCRKKHEIDRAEAFEREMDAFHRRRILCMLEIFSHIDCSVLFQRHIELGHYWKSVQDYARLRITAEQLGESRR